MVIKRRFAALLAAVLAAGLLALPATADSPDDDGWYRVQFADRIAAEDRAALTDLGARVLVYSPDHAFLAWLSPTAAAAAADLDGVTAVRPLEPADKVDQALRDAHGPLRAEATVHGARGHEASAALTTFGTVFQRYPADPDGDLEIVAFDTHAAALAAAAAVPEVLHIGPGSTGLVPEDEGTAQIVAGNLEGLQPVPGYPDFLDDIGLDGEGVTFSILDTGVDGNHPDLAGKVVGKIEYSSTPAAGEPHDTFGHGTHVAGIVAGAGAPLPAVGDVRDDDGFLYGQGVAPATDLIDQNAIAITSGSFPPDGGWERLTRDALQAGAVGWNASLHSGEGTGAGYIASARMLDVLTRDGDFSTDGDQAFTMVWSAGNAGSQPQTMTSPKEAKNIITVGSTLSQRAGPINMVSGFSSRGPAVDGRILPTVVAPGQLVASAIPVPASALHALCLGPELGSFGLHATCSGTSMAAPHAAGAVALIHQWWRGLGDGDDPSPAMSKALLINTATPLGRQPIPNNNEGWGMVNLGALFDHDAARTYVDQDVVLTEVDEEFTITVTPADPAQPLKVSLVWTDAAGAPGADPALVNDLDLEVTAEDGATWRGNQFEDFWSVPGGQPDRLNNLENVFIEQAGDGSYVITVRAHNLPEPAIPDHPSEVNQDFALVVSNALAVTD